MTAAYYNADGTKNLLAINARLDELVALADERRAQTCPATFYEHGGAGIDYLDAAEKAEMHTLKLLLPTFAEQRQQARERLQKRIAKRKAGALVAC